MWLPCSKLGLTAPSGQLVGVDNRPIYTADDHILVNGDGLGFGAQANAIFTNSDKGEILNLSFRAQKEFENGLYTSLAYSYLDSKDVNSIEAEITGYAELLLWAPTVDALSFLNMRQTKTL